MRFLLLQARSIARYFERGSLGRVIYIWNEATSLPEDVAEELDRNFNAVGLDLHWAADIRSESTKFLVDDGWTTQQALKLLGSKHVLSENYLILDAKNHFLRPVSARAFISEDGKARSPLIELGDNKNFEFCMEYFGLSHAMGARPHRGRNGETPFLVDTSLVRRMIDEIERKESLGLRDVFDRYQHRLTEFFAYQAFLASIGIGPAEAVDEVSAYSVTVWHQLLNHDEAFDRIMASVVDGRASVFGVHWIAAALATEQQMMRISALWSERGLISSIAEGTEVFAATVANLSDGDKSYLAHLGLRASGV